MSLSCRLARKPVGRAGGARWAWPYPGTTAIPSGPIPEANLPRSLAEICAQSGPNCPIRLSSAGPGHETSLIRRAGTSDDGGAKHSQARELQAPKSIYHALIRLAIIFVNRLESLPKSGCTQCIGHGSQRSC